MSSQSVLSRFRKLNVSDQIRLVQELWDEIASKPEDIPVTKEQRAILEERLQRHGDKPDLAGTWEQVRDEILGEL